MDEAYISRVAKFNDDFRSCGQGVVVTKGVQALNDLAGLLAAVRLFKSFNKDNDPYGEHDFGSLDWQGEKIFWKIDYHDQALQYWQDPLSPECQRVLTIMLASEY